MSETAASQGAVAVPSFRNRQVVRQDNVIAISTLGEWNAFASTGDGVLVTSDFPLYLVVVPDTSTAVATEQRIEGVNVFPNPAPDILVIQRKDHRMQYLIEVCTIDGRRVQSQDWHAGVDVYQLSLQGYAPGTYVVTISDTVHNCRSTYRVVKP